MMSGDHYISLKGRVSKTFLTICLVYIITLLTDKLEFSHHQYLSNTVWNLYTQVLILAEKQRKVLRCLFWTYSIVSKRHFLGRFILGPKDLSVHWRRHCPKC